MPERYLLQGLLVCGQCGRAYYGKPSGGRTYYRCTGTDAHRFGGQRLCHNAMVRVDRLDVAVWQDVRSLLLEPGRVEAEYHRRLAQQAPGSDRDRRALTEQIDGLRRRIARLTDMYEDGFMERGVFRERMASARARLDELHEEARVAAEGETSQAELRAVIGHLDAFAERVHAGLDESDWGTRQAIIRALVKRIVFEANEVRVVYKVGTVPFEAEPQGRGVLRYCCRRYFAPLGLRFLHHNIRWCNAMFGAVFPSLPSRPLGEE